MAWTTSIGGKYTWTVNNGRIGWAASESLLAENTNQKGTNYKWEMRKASNILSDLAQGKSMLLTAVGISMFRQKMNLHQRKLNIQVVQYNRNYFKFQ